MAMTMPPHETGTSPADQASCILQSSAYQPIRHLKCTFRGGVLTITGHVSSFHMKQVAQVAVQGITGVQRIENQIVVVD